MADQNDSREVAALIAQQCRERNISYNNTKIQKLLLLLRRASRMEGSSHLRRIPSPLALWSCLPQGVQVHTEA